MRFVLASVLSAFVVGDDSCEQREQVAMLQMKDRSALSTKENDLSQAVSHVAQTLGDDAQVQSFLTGVKNVAKTVPETNDGTEALLQRASQGEQIQGLINKFQALSMEDQKKLSFAGGGIFNTLPKAQRAALVQQVSHALDEGVSGKPKTTTENTAEGKKTTTYDSKTGYYHSHTHGAKGTESVSRGKHGGHYHRHKYSHDGSGGNARTETDSESIGGHKHSHRHEHRADGGTVTNTASSNGDWAHQHNHVHNERNGNSHTDSDSWSNGQKTWHHGHDHDATTGEWKAHDINGEMKWNWDWLIDSGDHHDDHHGHDD